MLIKGIDPGGAERSLQVDENGTLEVGVVSGVALSVSFDAVTSALPVSQVSDSTWSVNVVAGSTAGTEYTAGETADPGDGTLMMVLDSVGSIYVPRLGAGESGSALRTAFATDSIASVNIVSGSASGTEYTEGATADPGNGGLILVKDSAGSIFVARVGAGESVSALRVVQATDSVGSVSVVSGEITAYTEPSQSSLGLNETTDSTLRIVQMTDSVSSVNVVNANSLVVSQVSGGTWSVASAAQGLNENSAEVLKTYQVSACVTSVNIVSSSVSGGTATQAVTGTVAADVADDGSAPVLTGGIARTANPAAVAAGDRVSATFDDLGRQVMTPYQVRDLVTTAYITMTTQGEVALLAGAASTFHDLMQIVAANESTAAVNLDIRTGTAGTVIASVTVPASSTAGFIPAVPIPQAEAAQAWTVAMDGADYSNTTVNVTGLFIKNV